MQRPAVAAGARSGAAPTGCARGSGVGRGSARVPATAAAGGALAGGGLSLIAVAAEVLAMDEAPA